MISSQHNRPRKNKAILAILMVVVSFNCYLACSLLGIIEHRAIWTTVSFGLVYAGFFGLFYWVLWLAGVEGRKRRQAREELRRRGAIRSPWGQVRTTDPQPFAERLTAFKSAYGASASQNEEDSQVSVEAIPLPGDQDDSFQSAMSYWSIVDVPRDIEPPKPVWYLRRMLQRIRDALQGYHR